MVQDVGPFLSGLYTRPSPTIRGEGRSSLNPTSLQNIDTDSLTSEGREALKAISEGVAQLQEADINLARQRLDSLRERIGIVRDLLAQADSDQFSSLIGQVRGLGNELNNLGSQIAEIVDLGASRSSISAQFSQSAFAQEFNISASDTGARGVSYAESLNVEFSFLRVSSVEETLSVSRGEDGLIVERTIEQTELVVAQLNIESTRTLSVEGDLAGPASREGIEALLADFNNVAEAFDDLASSILDQLNEEFPGTHYLIDALKNSAQLQEDLYDVFAEIFDGGIIELEA